MRYLATVSIAVFLLTPLFSQTTQINSLKRQLALASEDRDRINIMIEISRSFDDQTKFDSSFKYGSMAVHLSRKINWDLGQARGLLMAAIYTFFNEHNYIKCISDCLYALTVFEKEKDTVYLLRNLWTLGGVYSMVEEYPQAIFYFRREVDIAKKNDNHYRILQGIYGLADAFNFSGKTDSAIMYFQEGFKLTNLYSLPDSNFAKGRSYLGLARASRLSHDYDIALSYLNKAYSYAQFLKFDGSNIKGTIQGTYADVFRDLQQWDSALYRIRLSSQVGNGLESGIYEYYGNLDVANVFEHINKDSAIKYYKWANQVRAALNSSTRSEINKLTQMEVERQREISEQEELKRKSRYRNIQYTAIAIGLGTLVILFLLYSRSIIGKEKLIRYLGIMLLLVVFEFLNLYLHPFLGHITDESPLLMLLTMVALAAILIPAHHRIEDWVSHQLVEKNKRIRLEAARKTIKQLEG
jgi:tetratricopeptide (TPR) repeat protein